MANLRPNVAIAWRACVSDVRATISRRRTLQALSLSLSLALPLALAPQPPAPPLHGDVGQRGGDGVLRCESTGTQPRSWCSLYSGCGCGHLVSLRHLRKRHGTQVSVWRGPSRAESEAVSRVECTLLTTCVARRVRFS
eukprot:3760861-Rhodomonas_salina.2